MRQSRISQIKSLLKKRFKPYKRRDQYSEYTNVTGFNGGLINPNSGAGTSLDKNTLSYFSPTRITSKNFHETLYIESWAAAKFINIPVDDMFVKWREFADMDNETIDLVQKAEIDFKIKSKLSKAVKSGRLYGTGLFVILTKDSSPDMPLNINRMLPGDLANIITVDRFDATVIEKEKNPYSINYGKPLFYRITLKRGGSLSVHHSRVIRFDGIIPMSDNSWNSYDEDWGVASIIPVITEIFQDANVSKGIAHLVNEASIKNMKIDGFEDILDGTGDPTSLTERMALTTQLMSNYRTNFMDKEDDFTRSEITFSNLPELMDRNGIRLASAAGIPATRFLGTQAQGLGATGEGDARNYALKVSSDQENQLPEGLSLIDSVLEKHLNLSEKINYKFVSILDLSEKDQVEIALKKSQAVLPLVTAGIIDEDEARSVIDSDPIFGDFDDLGEPLPGAGDEFKRNLANIQIQRQQAEGPS